MFVNRNSDVISSATPERTAVETLASVIVIALLSLIFSGFNRPIWIDEYLHFAMAGIPWSETFELMASTNANVNHGQTWLHQTLSVATLNSFGAGTFGLRLISWASTVGLLISLYLLLRAFYVPPFLMLLFAGILVAIPTTAFELGNSRSYIFLMTATSVSAWVLFSTMIMKRTSWYQLLIFTAGVLLGAMSHPYFPVVLCGIVAAFVASQFLVTRKFNFLREKRIAFLLIISMMSGGASVATGYLTWMRGSPDFSGEDPFAWLPVGLEFFTIATIVYIVLAIALVVRVIKPQTPSRRIQFEPKLAAGLTLVILGLGLALFFSWVSIAREYLVLPRQWLPGVILFSIGVTFLAAHLLDKAKTPVSYRAQAILAVVLTTLALGGGIGREVVAIQLNSKYWDQLGISQLTETVSSPGNFFSVAGNLNLKCGGVVWPEHSLFYEDGLTPTELLPVFASAYKKCIDD
jgi:hypothetical protein